MDGLSQFNEFLRLHANQLKLSGVPQQYWQTIYRKLRDQTFDAGDAFSLLLIDYGEDERHEEDPLWTVCVSKPDGIKVSSPYEIYIIDHAWTFRYPTARRQLQQIPALLHRMSTLMGCADEENEEKRIDSVMHLMWKYCQMYSINSTNIEISIENRMPIWYVMDELGSGVNHSDSPSFRVVPFMHLPEGITYSLLFPIADCDEGDYVTRDFVEGTPANPELRNALLLPWQRNDFSNVSFEQDEADFEYFISGHIEETLPENTNSAPQVDKSRPLKVFTTYSLVAKYLNDPAFQLVENESEADVLWLTTHFKDYKALNLDTPNRFVNQFPFEYVLTIKDLLNIVCRRTASKYNDDDSLETNPKWLPTTFNMKTELIKFISYYQNREIKELDNHWIIKPWNLARGLDTYITSSLPQVIRLQSTGPKIVQKYIDRPVLFDRSDVDGKVKFDIRYVFLLKSVDPLDAYIYTNFFLRFSNKPFSLNQFDDYEKHFTVMNYGENLQLRHIPCKEFLELWKEQYPQHDWSNIELSIGDMLRQVLVGATMKAAPCGITQCSQSRALYAADIMLEWTTDADEKETIQPKLLEINWIPDCQRACEYYPQFFNDIFKLLFLDENDENLFKNITNV